MKTHQLTKRVQTYSPSLGFRRNLVTGLRVTAFATLLLAALISTLRAEPPARNRANLNPKVCPPNSRPFGKSYGEWVAAYWQWLFSFPNAHSPAYEQGAVVFGAQNQSGPVWILESGNSGVWERSVHIPAGKAILFSVGGAEIDTNTANGTLGGTSQDLFGFLDFVFGSGFVFDASGEVDGVPLGCVDRYLARSPAFDLTVPDDGFAGEASGTWLAAAQGWFFILTPLPKGQHTIHVRLEAPDFNYVGDTTYHVIVK